MCERVFGRRVKQEWIGVISWRDQPPIDPGFKKLLLRQ